VERRRQDRRRGPGDDGNYSRGAGLPGGGVDGRRPARSPRAAHALPLGVVGRVNPELHSPELPASAVPSSQASVARNGRGGTDRASAGVLRILVIGNSEDGARATVGQLEKLGRPVAHAVASAPESVGRALDEGGWDLVIGGLLLPGLGPSEVLGMMWERDLDAPYIVVTGGWSEEVAAEAMRAGARDCLPEDDLARLAPAAQRELREAEIRKEKREAERDHRRTEESLRSSLEALLALREAGRILGSTLEPEEVGARLLEIMRGFFGLTAATIDVEDGGGGLRVWREAGLEALPPRVRYAPEAEAARNEAFRTGESRQFVVRRPEGGDARSLRSVCLPLRVQDRTVGVLEAYGSGNLADEDVGEVLSSLAAQAAGALGNARLHEKLSESERRLQDLVNRLLVAYEEERRRVAYEVHDGLTQTVVAAYHHLQALSDLFGSDSRQARQMLDKIVGIMRQTIEESRRVIADLRPTVLDDFGLAAAIRLKVKGLREEGREVEFFNDLGKERLPAEVETVLYRVAQEALTNARKHAGDDARILVRLGREDGALNLQVRDWGAGFDPAGVGGAGPGEQVGISGMRERIALVGGEIELRSARGAGTSVTVRVPMRTPEREGPPEGAG